MAFNPLTQHLIGQSFPVLDQGFVQLIDLMPHPATGVSPDMAVVNAARVSFLGESKGEVADKKLLFYLMRNKHTTPFEQVQFKFRIHAPLVTHWQWVRHRTFSFNYQSGRYTPFEEDQVYVPTEWRKQSSSNKQGSDGVVADHDARVLDAELEVHYEKSFSLYRDALNRGVSKELARLFLPGFSMYYTMVCSIDAHNLMHFLRLRMAADAQYEIRAYADEIYDQIFRPLMPWTAEAFEEQTQKPA